MDDVEPRPRAWVRVETPSPQGVGVLVELGGEWDVESIGAVGADIDMALQYEPQAVVLDLGDVTFIDSSGVAILVRLANHFASVRVRRISAVAQRIVELLGLGERFPVTPDNFHG
jgi:anti-sigma B factor antagonist